METEVQNPGDQMEAAAPVVTENEQTQAQETQEQSAVPLSALQAERAQRQELQDELRAIKEHLSLLQSSQPQAQEKPKDDFEGLDDTDVLTVGDFKKLAGKFQQQQQISIEELKMTQKHPDYQEIITKYLPDVLKTNPGLQRSLQQTQDYELAYYLAKNSDKYKEDNKKVKKSIEAERIMENLSQPGNLSSVGSTSPISQAKQYKEMSDQEFRNLMNKNLGVI